MGVSNRAKLRANTNLTNEEVAILSQQQGRMKRWLAEAVAGNNPTDLLSRGQLEIVAAMVQLVPGLSFFNACFAVYAADL